MFNKCCFLVLQDGDVKMLWPGPDTLILMARVMSHVSNIWRLWLWPALARERRKEWHVLYFFLLDQCINSHTRNSSTTSITMHFHICTLYTLWINSFLWVLFTKLPYTLFIYFLFLNFHSDTTADFRHYTIFSYSQGPAHSYINNFQ